MSLSQQQCSEFWKLADRNGDDNLTVQELAYALRKYKPGIPDSEVAGMFCGIDRDGDRSISYREFVQEMVEKPKRSAALRQHFKKCDTDGSGSLTRLEVMSLLKEYFPKDQVHCIIGEFLEFSDKDGDGVITWDEFIGYFG